MAEVTIQESKFVRLAEAIPAEKYTWRPSPDVRTIAQVFLHASAANFNLYKLVGTPTPADVNTKTLEDSTIDKAKVIATLKASYVHAKAAIRAVPEFPVWKKVSAGMAAGLPNEASCSTSFRTSRRTLASRSPTRSVGVAPPADSGSSAEVVPVQLSGVQTATARTYGQTAVTMGSFAVGRALRAFG